MKYLIILLFGLSSIQLSSCEKVQEKVINSNPKNQEKKESIVCENVNILCTQTVHGEYVIRNNTEYQALLDRRSPHPDCEDYTLPEVDFNEFTLVGFRSSVSGCSIPVVSHEILQVGNGFEFNILIEKNGFCERNNQVTIWCLIPAIEEVSGIEFVVSINTNID